MDSSQQDACNKVQNRWRKVLYEDQGVPDNYVDSSFLLEMKKNLFLREYNYYSLVLDTGCVTQQMNAIIFFVMCFVYLKSSLLHSYVLNSISGVVLLLSYLFTRRSNYETFDLKAVVIFCTASFVLLPVLMSLTDSISTDTIYAMTTLMLLLHLASHNYQSDPAEDSVVSFNVGIFATVCLASRLKSLTQGYSLIVLSVLIFAVLPGVRRVLRRVCFAPYTDLAMTLLLFGVTLVMVWSQTITLALLMLLLFLFITFVCPYILLHLQPIKNNVYGPWDEAVVAEK